MKHNDPIDAISEAFAPVGVKPREITATITPEGVKTDSFFQNFYASKRQQWSREKVWAAIVPIDSVCGVVWGVEGAVEGESATAMLMRLDAGFHARVEQAIKNSPLCVNANSDEWPSDFMRTLQGQVMDYLNEHSIRKQALKCAFMEYVPPPIVMSREEFERTYIGTFIRDGSKCKCGTSWDAILYGAKCGRCGEKRPVSPVATIKVTDLGNNK